MHQNNKEKDTTKFNETSVFLTFGFSFNLNLVSNFCFCLFITIWSMHGITLLIAHLKSCSETLSRLQFFDLMFIRIENLCSQSQVEEKINGCGTAWEASVEYEKTILSQKFIAEHSLRLFFCCLILLRVYQFLLLPCIDRSVGWVHWERICDVWEACGIW